MRGRGHWSVSNIKNWGQDLVAMCDMNEERVAPSFKLFPDVPKYQDFRKMLDEMDKQIDAVIVSTPDHTHAVISVRAMRMGKHVFCEKPLAHNVYEAQLMRRVKVIMRVKAECYEVDEDSYPRWEIVQWDFPPRGEMPPVTVYWYRGPTDVLKEKGIKQRLEETVGWQLDWGDVGERKWRDWAGSLLVGTKGVIYGTGHSATIELLPAAKFKGVDTKRPTKLPLSRGPKRDWFEACQGGSPPWSNFCGIRRTANGVLLARQCGDAVSWRSFGIRNCQRNHCQSL